MTGERAATTRKATGMPWRSHGITHTGSVRNTNEDAFTERPDAGLWAVADGMGGHNAGDVASRMIIDALDEIEPSDSLADYLDQIEDRVSEVNRQLVERRDNGAVSGSTVLALVACRREGRPRHLGAVLWAGDSRLYRYRRGDLQQLTTDHSRVEEYIRQGRLSREEAAGHPEGNVITRAVGAREDLALDADLCELCPGDRYLLCTDGLMKHLPDTEIAEVLEIEDVERAARELIERTLDRGAGDNTTVVIVDIVN